MTYYSIDNKKKPSNKCLKKRPDFLFSYWVFAWFLVFYFIPDNAKWSVTAFIKQNMNPEIALYLALLENIGTMVTILLYNPTVTFLAKYSATILIVKVWPMYLLRNYPVRWYANSAALLGIFAIYNVYLLWNDTNIVDVYHKTFASIRNGDDCTPLFGLFAYISRLI